MQRLDAATDGAAVFADIRFEMAAQFLQGAPIPDREARLAALRAEIEAAAAEEMLVRNLYAFRKVGLQDLEAYVAAHENEAMGWLSRQVGYGMRDLMVAATGRMIGAILDVTMKKP